MSDMQDSPDARDARLVGRWLALFAALVFLIVLAGGATRLTESGLSITEWKPVSGVIPPLGEEAWQAEFAKYQRIPQYGALNPDMTMSGFRRIYLWEYGHRLLARMVGLVFLVPLLWLAVRRRLPLRTRSPLVLVALGLLGQAAMGWWMVKSGLTERVAVSHYRLAAHLATALLLLGFTIWIAAGLLEQRAVAGFTAAVRRVRPLAALLALAFVTVVSGALVAGLRAGRIYNTFPLMAGQLVPAEYAQLDPWWRNLFDNPAAVQLNHRVLAIATFALAVALYFVYRRIGDSRFARRMRLVLAAAVLQVALGIATLLLAVPVWLGVAHQGGAVLLLVAVLLALHAAPGEEVPQLGADADTAEGAVRPVARRH